MALEVRSRPSSSTLCLRTLQKNQSWTAVVKDRQAVLFQAGTESLGNYGGVEDLTSLEQQVFGRLPSFDTPAEPFGSQITDSLEFKVPQRTRLEQQALESQHPEHSGISNSKGLSVDVTAEGLQPRSRDTVRSLVIAGIKQRMDDKQPGMHQRSSPDLR